MADSTTTHYGWVMPEVGASADSWGGKINVTLAAQDATVFAISTLANAAMPKTGGTFTGAVISASDIQAATFHGPLTGNLFGNVLGNLTGNVTGNLTGNVTGNVSGSSGSTTGNAATATALTAGSKTILGDLAVTGAASVAGAVNAGGDVASGGAIYPHFDGSFDFSLSQTGAAGSLQRTVNFTAGRYITWLQSGDTVQIGNGSTAITLSNNGRVDITGTLWVNGVQVAVP